MLNIKEQTHHNNGAIQIVYVTLLFPQQLITLADRIDKHLLRLNELLQQHWVAGVEAGRRVIRSVRLRRVVMATLRTGWTLAVRMRPEAGCVGRLAILASRGWVQRRKTVRVLRVFAPV